VKTTYGNSDSTLPLSLEPSSDSPGMQIEDHISTSPCYSRSSGLDSKKVKRDIEFAISAIQAGSISERQLKCAIQNWTIHGRHSLASHLETTGLINSVEVSKLSQITAGDSLLEAGNLRVLRDRVFRILGTTLSVSETMQDASKLKLDHFTMVRKFVRGSLGDVWLARDESLTRLVVVKQMNRQASQSPMALARFRREAEVTGRLEHPNIVPIYQFGYGDNDEPFYTMRFVGKRTLSDAISDYHARCNEGIADVVELRRLLSFFLSVCQAIAFAHSRHVLHRDLKPENIALGNFGEVVILDWGLAKYTEEGEGNDERHLEEEQVGVGSCDTTVLGQVLGTPYYMSPEQAAGHIDKMDERTDVYGLGAVLFTILTGVAPHEAGEDESTSKKLQGPDLYTAIVENPTPRAIKFNSAVSRELDAICAKAMAGTPASRYPSAADLAEDVEHWMAGESISAYKMKLKFRCMRCFKSHMLLLSVFAMTVCIIAFSFKISQITIAQAQMQNLQMDGEGLRMHFVSSIDKSIEDARFMANIPPIQAIINSRQDQSETPGTDSFEQPIETEEMWLSRLESIYIGMVRANSQYMSLSFCRIVDEGETSGGEEIVHVERNRSDRSYVTSLPADCLNNHLIELESFLLLNHKPGDVHVGDLIEIDVCHATGEVDQTRFKPLLLDLSVPIFDEKTGTLFGVVILSIDVNYVLRQQVNGVDAEHVMLVNSEGQLLTCNLHHYPTFSPVNVFSSFFTNKTADFCLHPPDKEWPNGLYAVKIDLSEDSWGEPISLLLEGESPTVYEAIPTSHF